MHAQTVATTSTTETTKQTLVTVDAENAPLATVLESIARQSGLNLFWNEAVSGSTARVTMHLRAMPADEAFAKVLTGTGLRAKISTSMVAFVPEASASAKSGEITGTVVDAKTKHPVRGALVTLDEAKRGVSTGDDGRFRITTVSTGAHVVRVRLLGYGKASKAVAVEDGQATTVEFALEASANALEQVVVTGTVIPTELKAVPNAMTVITAKEIEQRGITQIQQLFHGDVPGLYATNMGDNAFEVPGFYQMASRGSTNLDFALSQPIKAYVDGIEMADPSYLGLIDPKSVERIEILTGPQASTIYGSNAINGVIQIFTKRGSTVRPQLTATLQGGFIQNNFSSSLAPQHDDQVQVSGTDGHLSYNVGGSWVYVGPWTPAVHSSTISAFGGGRWQNGPITADLSLRRIQGSNRELSYAQTTTEGGANGLYKNFGSSVLDWRFTNTNQTISLGATYSPTSWWSHTATLGTDALTQNSQAIHPGWNIPADSLITFSTQPETRLTVAYSTTAQIPVTSLARANVTAGVDGWNLHSTQTVFSGTSLTNNPPVQYASYMASHNRGAYVQGQLGMWDALFLTYGFRAEWNPNFGAEIRPNYTPRYGIAYTRDLGPVTAKLRGSYGHSTRPPTPGLTKQITTVDNWGDAALPIWGNQVIQVGNRELLPEQQQGGEGGLELYLGTRASLIVTRYNQTVNNLIQMAYVDSIASVVPYNQLGYPDGAFAQWPDGYAHSSVVEYLNIGSIRNQGWELQGTVTTGPLTTKGTYSWTKSRIIGITPRWASVTLGQYVVGSSFTGLPEHLWAISESYAVAGTNISLNVQGQAPLFYYAVSDLTLATYLTRNTPDRPRMNLPPGVHGYLSGYTTAELNASRRITTGIDALVQVQNLANRYRNDQSADRANLGRQTKFGLRARF